MNICLVVPYDLTEQGGVKRHAFQLAAELRALGDTVTVMGASSQGSDDPEVVVFGGIINIRSNGSDNRLAMLTPPWRIREWLHERAFDVVHVHEPLCPLLAPWAAIFAGDSARVATFHAFAEREALGPRLLRKWSAPLVLRHFDRAIAVSTPAATYARYVWKRELAIIPNGIPLAAASGPAPQPHPPGEPLRLLFIGHWRDARKGLPVLLTAVAALRARGRAVTLDVIGSGPSGVTPPVADGVHYHGTISSEAGVAEQIRRCDVLVAPALGQESFGIVLLEAMAEGRPIVCSDIEGFRQVVGEANARLVPPGDPDALAAAIDDLAVHPEVRRQLGAANRVRVQTFAWSSLVHRVRAEYLQAIDHRAHDARAAS